jgi:hypothetical protein
MGSPWWSTLSASPTPSATRKGALRWPPNPQLAAAAHEFAAFMARTGQLSHTADSQTPEARAQAHGDDPCLIAENMASPHHPAGLTSDAPAQGCFEGWQHSPDHRKHVPDPAVTETGVGIAQSQQTGAYDAVQPFGRPRSQQIAFQLTSHTDATISMRLTAKCSRCLHGRRVPISSVGRPR